VVPLKPSIEKQEFYVLSLVWSMSSIIKNQGDSKYSKQQCKPQLHCRPC